MPNHHISAAIYKFRYQCNVDCVGRMGQNLEIWINQHVPANIHKRKVERWVNASSSVIAEYLIKNQQCAQSYTLDIFSVLIEDFEINID